MISCQLNIHVGLPGGSVVKTPPANAGDAGSQPGSGRSPGEGNGNPLQYSCLRNPMDRGASWATGHGVTKESDTTERLSTHPCPALSISFSSRSHAGASALLQTGPRTGLPSQDFSSLSSWTVLSKDFFLNKKQKA